MFVQFHIIASHFNKINPQNEKNFGFFRFSFSVYADGGWLTAFSARKLLSSPNFSAQKTTVVKMSIHQKVGDFFEIINNIM
jgi:hypothetical protein